MNSSRGLPAIYHRTTRGTLNRNVFGSNDADSRVGSRRFLDHCQGENIGTSQSARAVWLMIRSTARGSERSGSTRRADESLLPSRCHRTNLHAQSNQPLLPIGTAKRTVVGIIVRWPGRSSCVRIALYYWILIYHCVRWSRSKAPYTWCSMMKEYYCYRDYMRW